MKKLIALAAALMLLCCGLYGCESESDKIDAIAGHWETVNYYTSDSVYDSLVGLDLYEEEIALLDLSGIGLVDVIEFNTDKTYTITCNVDKSMAMVEQYFRDAFTTFYQNRDELDDCYEDDLSAMTEAEFQQFYVDLYAQESFDALIELFASCITDEEHLLEDTETGTYRVLGNKVWCTPEGGSEAEYIVYSVEGDVLTLTWADGAIEYTRQ